MKKYRVIIPGINKELKFTIPKSLSIKNFRLMTLLSNLESKTLYLLLGILPFSYLFFNELTDEASIYLFALIGLIILVGIYLGRSVLIGFKNLREPKGLIPVLTFGLLLSLIALINDPATSANTFGTDTVKG